MPLTILVADDDPGIRLAISDYLELSGYFLLTAENGADALAMVEEYQPHLLIADVTMPGMDGYELVRRVRAKPAFRLLPVIFLTARTNTEERIRGYQLGCDLYMPKPFELSELGAVVRNLMERSHLIQAEWRSHVNDPTAVEPEEADPISGNLRTSAGLTLTQREQEVLDLLTDGLSNIQIGEKLHLSPRTVEKYVSSLLRKTETNNRAELVRFALEHNLIK